MEPINVVNKNIITSGNMSANISSLAVDIADINNYSVQFTWSGTTPVGTVSIGISNDGINFDYTNLGAAKAVGGNSGTLIIKDSNVGYKFIQAIFTFTSGIGSLNAILNAKRI